VRSIASHALDRSALSALDCGACARSRVTTYKFHDAAMKAMAARATCVSQVYMDAPDPGPHAQV
jgi:hypothetical protein